MGHKNKYCEKRYKSVRLYDKNNKRLLTKTFHLNHKKPNQQKSRRQFYRLENHGYSKTDDLSYIFDGRKKGSPICRLSWESPNSLT
jgi:hypothetical protein